MHLCSDDVRSAPGDDLDGQCKTLNSVQTWNEDHRFKLQLCTKPGNNSTWDVVNSNWRLFFHASSPLFYSAETECAQRNAIDGFGHHF
jgi:hypothetical protein